MQERRRLPDGFLLMLLSHHFVVAFLVLTTFVVEPAVYNFMQTQKERKPCKIKASAANKRSARRRTRSGGPRTARTGAERRHRTFEPWQGSKKRTIPIWYRSFFKRETGIEAFSPVARVFQRLARGNLATGRGRSVRFTGYYVSLLPKVGEPP
jgi:hypothetical protein